MVALFKLLIFTLALAMPHAKACDSVVLKEFRVNNHKESATYSTNTANKFQFLDRASQQFNVGSNTSRDFAGGILKPLSGIGFFHSIQVKATLLSTLYITLGLSGVDIIFPFQYFW